MTRLTGLMILIATAIVPAPAGAEESRPASAICSVLQAAEAESLPADAVQPSRPGEAAFLAEQLPSVASALELTEADTARVAAKARADTTPYRAPCWGEPNPHIYGEEQRHAVFTRPIFLSADTAVLQKRLDAYDRGGTWICVVRRDSSAWRANCQQTLVWAH